MSTSTVDARPMIEPTGEVIADLVKQRTPSIDLAPFSPARFRNGTAHPVKIADMI